MVNQDKIVRFLEGKSPRKYITSIEVPYGKNEAKLFINDPERGKYIATERYKSFLWFKDEVTKLLYKGNRILIAKAVKKYEIKITKLNSKHVETGITPKRMMDGFNFIAKTNHSSYSLIQFFKEGGLDIYGDEHKNLFICLSPVEQYMIYTGKRLFKGIDDYSDVHRLQFDIETTGLVAKGKYLTKKEITSINLKMANPKLNEDLSKLYEFDVSNNPIRYKDCEIFQIGIRDNKGFEEILEVPHGTKAERKKMEIYVCLKFFDIIDKLKPDIIVGYNSEFFDWPFIQTRCEMNGIDIVFAAKTRDTTGRNKFKRVKKTIKLGGESEIFKQTRMWGYNIVDASFSVRKAKAINSSIKRWGLKYITKYSKLNKPNRVYVKGDKIHSIWADKVTDYAFNNVDGNYYVITPETPLKEGFDKVKGNTIIRRYLLDDLWETEKIDEMYNQSSFLLSKIIPTTYERSTTMGTAGIWKLIMCAWSYENNLSIPSNTPKKTFTGGLSRVLEVGYAKNVVKLDYAALYPNIELTWDIFSDTDISGAMKGLLLYIASTRDKFKELKNKYNNFVDELKNKLKNKDLSKKTINLIKSEITKNELLASTYDKKQLPIKILGNSFFGSFGAPNIFNWGDTDTAEEITCTGRQSLRLMVHFFMNKGFRPLVGDTDGMNFLIPLDVSKYNYTPKGTHRFTKNNKGLKLNGLLAVVADFNERHMIGRMGLDIDDICESTINFSRKNYANLIKGEVKLVGNTIKSSKMPTYIEEFLDEGITHLLNGDGNLFIDLYNKTVEDIYNFRIPLAKIASKANVKDSVISYKEDMLTKTKSGNYKARKAHMELLIKHNLNANLGSTIYYVNTGKVKSNGDCKITTNKETGKREVILNCKLIPTEQIENNPDLTTDEYNVPKYLENFNKRIHPLLVCFSPEIRDKILVNMTLNKKTKKMEINPFNAFTLKETKLVNGLPFEDTDQDDLNKDLMMMEDKEIEFWLRVNKTPRFIDELKMNWKKIVINYKEKKRIEKINGIKLEKEKINELSKRLEIDEIKLIKDKLLLTIPLQNYCHFDYHNDINGLPMIYLISNKWGVELFTIKILLKYENWAKKRSLFYMSVSDSKQHTYENWLKNELEKSITLNNSNKIKWIENELKNYD